MRIVHGAVGAALLAAACGGSEHPSEISGARGALEGFDSCTIYPGDGYATLYVGDYTLDIGLPSREGVWGRGTSTLYLYRDYDNWTVGSGLVRVQYGAALDEDPACDACNRKFRPLFVEGLHFPAAQICDGNGECFDFGGGSADRYYVWCNSPYEDFL